MGRSLSSDGRFSNSFGFFPSSPTRFSRHKGIWYCRQYHQFQYLCHRNHRWFSMSLSVPSSPRRSPYYPNFRPLLSLSCAEHFYYRPSSICGFQHREGSPFSCAEHFYHRFPSIRRSCEFSSNPPLGPGSPQIRHFPLLRKVPLPSLRPHLRHSAGS